MKHLTKTKSVISVCIGLITTTVSLSAGAEIGKEVSLATHLQNGDEYTLSTDALVRNGELMFNAVWTGQEGGGRPLSKGVGAPLSDLSSPLVFPRNFNRLSAPEANSCGGCHNKPRSGGGGDIVANVFVTGQRFDFATFDMSDPVPTRGAVDENGTLVTQQSLANSRNTLGMFGSGYIEMLTRQMTTDLRTIRDGIAAGGSVALTTKGISFGTLSRNNDGTWDTAAVTGLAAPSLASADADHPPSLVIMPFHQAGAVTSLRQFTNNAFNHHHGMQSEERFGLGVDSDGDGFVNELTRADVTAVVVYQAQLAVPGRVISNDPQVEAAVLTGEQRFADIGCTSCHTPALPLDNQGWIYSEPNPFNPTGNLQVGQADTLSIDLNSKVLDVPRLKAKNGVVMVPAYTDMKLHDITSGPLDPNREPIDQLAEPGSAEFFAGNSRFLTRKLWGVANEPPYFHHGQYSTMRQAIEAHHGEAETANQGWQALPDSEKDGIVEFLKSLQVLPAGTKALVVDENFKPKSWPPKNL